MKITVLSTLSGCAAATTGMNPDLDMETDPGHEWTCTANGYRFQNKCD